jgi:hypothetical protein
MAKPEEPGTAPDATSPDGQHEPTGEGGLIYEVLNLSVPIVNSLGRKEIRTVEQLLECTEADLLAIRNFGSGKLAAVVAELARHHLALAQEGPPRDRIEQLADITLRQQHRKQWLEIVADIRWREKTAAIRQASPVPDDAEPEPAEDAEDAPRPWQRTFSMTATRRIHADGSLCVDPQPCSQATWWEVKCSCGWSLRHSSKPKVKAERLSHGADFHDGLGQSAW